MSILGSQGKTEVIASGQFYCPSCDSQQAFEHKRVRRYFAVVIPIMKLEELGQYVECQTCRRTWNPEVLNYDPDATAQEYAAEFELAMRRVMVLMMMADGEIHRNEIKTIQRLYKQIAQVELSRDQVWDEVAAARSDGHSIGEYLPAIVGRLNTDGRNLVLQAAILVAMADGSLGAEEESLLEDVARSLEMSADRVREVIAEMPALQARRGPPSLV